MLSILLGFSHDEVGSRYGWMIDLLGPVQISRFHPIPVQSSSVSLHLSQRTTKVSLLPRPRRRTQARLPSHRRRRPTRDIIRKLHCYTGPRFLRFLRRRETGTHTRATGDRRFKPDLPAHTIALLHHPLHDPGIRKLLILPPQPQRRPGILDTIVFLELNLLFEQIPRQEPQTQFPAAGFDVEQIDRVEDLSLGDVDVDGAEILGETVADEDDAEVEQEPEFLVRDFERDEVVGGEAGVEVVGVDAGVLGQEVDDGLADGDVVVYEGEAFVFAGAAEDGDAGETKPFGPDGLARSVGFDFDFFFLEGDEFGVDCDV